MMVQGDLALQEQLAALANLGITPPPSAAGPPAAESTSAESLGKATQLATVQHVARLTAALAQWLPPVWTLTQVGQNGEHKCLWLVLATELAALHG